MQRQYGLREERRFPTVFVSIATLVCAVVVVFVLVLSYFSPADFYGCPYGGGMAGEFGTGTR